jgi:tetratricopeptide (TPR) repeat protein
MNRMFNSTTATLALLLATAGTVGDVWSDPALAADDDRRRLSARDMETAEDPRSEFAKQARVKRLASIDMLKELLAQGDAEGDRKAEMMLRLADLYFQEGRALYLEEMKAFDEGWTVCQQDERCDDQAYFNRGPNNAGSMDWQQKSIRLYEQILRNYPRYRRADEATYYLGMALQDTGKRPEGIEQFLKLVKQYPESEYVPDTFVNIGEYYFDENNAVKALNAYKRAAAYREHPKYSFALYKLAWCYFNVGEFDNAINTMKSVVSYTQTQGKHSKAIELQDEALKDLVRFFADAGEMSEAYEYFKKLGKDDLIRAMLKRLATMYFEQGKFEQSIQTYRRLITESPQAPENPDYQAEIIQATKKMGKRQVTFEEIERLRKTYGKQSAWARANATNQEAVKAALEAIEKNLRAVAVEYHSDAKKLAASQGGSEAYALAEQAYTVYLEEFPDNKHAYEVRYAFGELLYKLKKYAEAYEQYMAVVKMDPNGKHSRFCAESAIFAAEELIKADGGSDINRAAGKVSKDVQPQELTSNEQKLIDACAQFARLYPGTDKTKNAIYKSGYLLYNKFRFAEAAEQFNLVIKMDPKSREAEQAANLILDSFAIREDYANLKKNAKFYFEQEGLGSKKFKDEVYNIYQRASFQLIAETFNKDQDKVKAAEGYVAFYEEFKKSAELDVLATALNNATVYFAESKRHADAMRIRHILVDDPQFGDKTKYYYKTIESLGFAYENIAAFDQAAFFYEKLFSLYPKERDKVAKTDADAAAKMVDLALDAIFSAAVFRAASDKGEQAIANYRLFLEEAAKSKPSDERINDVKLTIARIYEDMGDKTRAANEYYTFYSKADKDVPMPFLTFAKLRHGKIMESQGKGKDAFALYRKTIDEYKAYIKAGGTPGEHTEHVAEMMYILAKPDLDKFTSMRITSRKGGGRPAEDKHMTAQLKAKQDELKRVEELFKEIITTQSGPWSLAALVALGRAQENMGTTLLEGDIPYYLTEDQAEFYRMGMQDRAYPRTQAAIELYRLALAKAYELTLYNEDTGFATRRLGELAPDDFPGLAEDILKPNFVSTKTRTFDCETEL